MHRKYGFDGMIKGSHVSVKKRTAFYLGLYHNGVHLPYFTTPNPDHPIYTIRILLSLSRAAGLSFLGPSQSSDGSFFGQIDVDFRTLCFCKQERKKLTRPTFRGVSGTLGSPVSLSIFIIKDVCQFVNRIFCNFLKLSEYFFKYRFMWFFSKNGG